MSDHRAVPLDVLRKWARDEAECTSLRSLAARAGMGRTTLAKFIDGATSPHPRVRRAVALLYLSDKASAADDAVRVLLAGLPDHALPAARLDLLAFVGELRTRARASAPGGTT